MKTAIKTAEKMISLDVSSKNITEMTGIEASINPHTRDCTPYRINRQDVSSNTFLYELDCTGNQLTTLDLFKKFRLFQLN
jgi:hypothetical protein